MKIVDANVVLRYLLSDVPELYSRSIKILEHEPVHLPFEVLAEIVYVLEKVYSVSRVEISNSISGVLKYQNISTHDTEVGVQALKSYADSNLDFIDALLYAYYKVRDTEILSFDRQLSKYIEKH
ncbi:MAG: PIN domain-containing protein [Spirochaetia bacterium]